MALLLETIKIQEGEVANISYHQKRLNQSRQALFGTQGSIDLQKEIQAPLKGLFRCRVLYNTKIQKIEYLPYTPKTITSLRVVRANIDYSYKYANRASFTRLLHAHQDVDEVIIEKNGYLSDTTMANIAFYDGKCWVTPKRPLLQGTMRAKLLTEKKLIEKDIPKEALRGYENVALMNAMIGFKLLNHFNIDYE